MCLCRLRGTIGWGREHLFLWLCNAGAVGELWAEQLRHACSETTEYAGSFIILSAHNQPFYHVFVLLEFIFFLLMPSVFSLAHWDMFKLNVFMLTQSPFNQLFLVEPLKVIT